MLPETVDSDWAKVVTRELTQRKHTDLSNSKTQSGEFTEIVLSGCY